MDERWWDGPSPGRADGQSWRIDEAFVDDRGLERRADSSTLEVLRARIGAPSGDGPTAPVVTGSCWEPGSDSVIELESGAEIPAFAGIRLELPLGYHRLHEPRTEPRRLIVAPRLCFQPVASQWGVAVQLYSARSSRSWGIGDLADLRALRAWTAEHRGGFVLVNPMHSAAPAGPQENCPYAPTTRLFRSPLYIRPDEVPGAHLVDLAAAVAAGRRLTRQAHIDRSAVWRLKSVALGQIFEATTERSEFEAWRVRQPPELRLFATWSALVERFGPRWPSWPAAYRTATSADVAAFANKYNRRVAFHEWLQWLIVKQSAGAGAGVIHDLAVGVAADGADAWIWPTAFVHGVTIGAPPDALNVLGQDWGLAPLHPGRMREAAYEPFIRLLRATFADSAGIRIDHILGLVRLWFIPTGAGAASGAYVRYPVDELLAVLALESHRAGSLVIGEDLGMVEPGTRERLRARGVFSSRALLLDEEPPSEWPAESIATVTTHDLPTVTGLWTGTDVADQRAAGLAAGADATAVLRERLMERTGVAAADKPAAVVAAAHRAVGRSPSLLTAVALEDLLGVPHRPNIPATNRPENWTQPLPVLLDDLDAAVPADVLDALTDGPPHWAK